MTILHCIRLHCDILMFSLKFHKNYLMSQSHLHILPTGTTSRPSTACSATRATPSRKKWNRIRCSAACIAPRCRRASRFPLTRCRCCVRPFRGYPSTRAATCWHLARWSACRPVPSSRSSGSTSAIRGSCIRRSIRSISWRLCHGWSIGRFWIFWSR